MNNKYLVVLLIMLLVFFTLACQSVTNFDLGITEFLQNENQPQDTQTWPKLRVGSVRPVENIGQLVVPAEAAEDFLQSSSAVLPPLPLEPVVSFSRPQPVDAKLLVNEILPSVAGKDAEQYILQEFFSPALTNDVLQMPVGTLQQINSFHLSTEQLQSINITVNGQPLFEGEDVPSGQTFPSRLLDISLCTDHQWQDALNGPVLVCARMEKVNTIFPSQIIPTKEVMLSLVMVGNVPGMYNLGLSTTDAAGRVQEITQKIEVTEPTQ